MTTAEIAIDCGQDVKLVRGRRMYTRDGIALVSDHYFPPGVGPHPTILMRQPYGRDIASTVVYAHPVWFARRGYNVVIQDVRGRGDSEGEFYPFRHEGPDGYDTVQWVASLAESTGKVAMYGFSYQAMTQFLAAVEQPPALVAIAPAMAAVDIYHGWFYRGGMFNLAGGLGWGNQMLREDARRLKLDEASRALEHSWADPARLIHHLPYGTAPALTAKGLPTYFTDWVTHDQPGPYWEGLDISAKLDRIRVPALHVAGWYDMYGQGTLDGFTRLSQKAGTAEARDHQYLVAGPWIHIPWGRYAGEADFGESALLDTDELLLAWFDRWLKEDQTAPPPPRVRAFALGSRQWHELAQWPPDETIARRQTWFLHSKGKANSSRGDGLLNQAEPASNEPGDFFVVDPEVPVAVPGGQHGAFRQNRVEIGNNVLIYSSEPLVEPFHLCGRPSVRLYARSSSPVCDLIAKLVRVDREEQAWNISLGAARAQWLFPQPGVADDIRVWEFELDGISCVFAVGEKIRLEIAGTAFPLLDRSSNLPDVPAREAAPGRWRRVTHELMHAPNQASRLDLPILQLRA